MAETADTDEQTTTVRIASGTHHHEGEVYHAGEIVELPDRVIASIDEHQLESRFVEVSDDAEPTADTGRSAGEFSPSAFLSKEPRLLLSEIEMGQVDDYLTALEAVERKEGRNRAAVVTRIEERRKEIHREE